MSHLVTIVIVSAVVAQFLSAILALRMIGPTRRSVAWVLIAAAITLMAFRRLDSLLASLSGRWSPDLLFELTGLVISLLMLAGMYLIRPIFLAITQSEIQQRDLASRLATISEEQRILLEHSRDFIFRHDPSGMITSISPAVELVTGFPPGEWLGHFARHFTDHPSNELARRLTEEMIRSGVPGPPYRIEVSHRNGGTLWLEVHKQPYATDGRVAGCVGVARDITSRVQLEEERERLVADLRRALGSIKTLKGLLPICASCKKIRDDHGYWSQIEAYLSEHSDAEFTHGLCPDCLQKLYPEMAPEPVEK